MTFIAGVGFGGWKLREKYEATVGAVKPNSIMAKVSKLWDGIVVSLSSSEADGGEGQNQKVQRQLEEKVRQLEDRDKVRQRDLRNLAAVVEDLRGRLDGQSYQHEFPPLPPSPPPRRP
ncbi:hypothetical protein HU200_024660 [Digitaria exilis]|uniref:Uncharacterized protein n=1 Tax=Digitaria exilis TaxID=1010633 RepID=A0A835C399_9POAL|nr:hypothetical protein HU200_024660 [Digitaria exilis]